MYMLSLKFGSGPSSCKYSSDGSRRTPMPGAYDSAGAGPASTTPATATTGEAAASTGLRRCHRLRRGSAERLGEHAHMGEASWPGADVPRREPWVVDDARQPNLHPVQQLLGHAQGDGVDEEPLPEDEVAHRRVLQVREVLEELLLRLRPRRRVCSRLRAVDHDDRADDEQRHGGEVADERQVPADA